MGVDYGGSGPLYALGSGVITSTRNSGWPGGAFIGLHLDSGQYVYYAEDITPHVHVGQRVSAGQLVGTATGGPSGIVSGQPVGSVPSSFGSGVNQTSSLMPGCVPLIYYVWVMHNALQKRKQRRRHVSRRQRRYWRRKDEVGNKRGSGQTNTSA